VRSPASSQQQQDDEQQELLLLLLPRQQLVLSQHLLSFFGSFKLPYLAVGVTEPQLLQLIGVTSEVSVQVVLQALVQLATGQQLQLQQHRCTEQDKQQQQQQQLGALAGQVQDAQQQQQQQQQSFDSSCKVMAGLYSYLLQQLQLAQQQAQTALAAATNNQQQQREPAEHYQQLQQQVQSVFQQYPLVWLPDAPAAAGSTDSCTGRFYRLRQLCLDDPSGVLEQLACQQLAAAAANVARPPQSDEVLQADSGAGAAVKPAALLRPVLLHYAGAGQLFSEWLAAAPAAAAAGAHHDAAGTAVSSAAAAAGVNKGHMLREPGMAHYIAALQLLAAEAAERQQQGLPDAHLGRDSAIWTKVSCDLRTCMHVACMLPTPLWVTSQCVWRSASAKA
jgi:hypothetical protein